MDDALLAGDASDEEDVGDGGINAVAPEGFGIGGPVVFVEINAIVDHVEALFGDGEEAADVPGGFARDADDSVGHLNGGFFEPAGEIVTAAELLAFPRAEGLEGMDGDDEGDAVIEFDKDATEVGVPSVAVDDGGIAARRSESGGTFHGTKDGMERFGGEELRRVKGKAFGGKVGERCVLAAETADLYGNELCEFFAEIFDVDAGAAVDGRRIFVGQEEGFHGRNPRNIVWDKRAEGKAGIGREAGCVGVRADGIPWEMKRRAIVTLCIGAEAEAMARISHPRMERYAARCGAEFVVLGGEAGQAGAQFEKARAAEVFRRHDRIAFLDTDTLVSDRCANVFAVVPEGMFGAWMESDEYDRGQQIRDVCAALGPVEWERDYFNSGVMVLSREHSGALGFPFGMYEDPWYAEQTVVNYNVRRLKIPVFPLAKEFNYFAARFPSGTARADLFRFGAGIIHYAGTPAWKAVRLEAMRRDDKILAKWDVLRPCKSALTLGGRGARAWRHYRGAIARRLR